MGQVIKTQEPVKTVLTIVIGFLVIHFIAKAQWPLYVSFIVGTLGLISGRLALLIDLLWMKLAWVLSFVVPNILLPAVFFLVLTPVALLSRIFGEKNQLGLKNTEASMFKVVDKVFDKASMERPW